jgi:beta-glucanase (GH16 family)
VDEEGDNWYHNVEIDFVEIFDATRARAEVNVHFGQFDRRTISVDYPLDENYHAYTVRWTPEGVHIFVDGVEITRLDEKGQRVPVINVPEAVPDKEHRLVIQVDQAGIPKDRLSREPSPVRNLIEVRAVLSRPYTGPK